MNICIDIIYNAVENSSELQPAPIEPLITEKAELQKTRISESPKIKNARYIKNAWNKTEKRKYIKFLKRNAQLFALSPEKRKELKINVLMSHAIKSRTPALCHSYHQKMMIKYGTIQNIMTSQSDVLQKKLIIETFNSIQSEQLHSEEKIMIVKEQQKNEPYWMKYIDVMQVQDEPNWVNIQYESE